MRVLVTGSSGFVGGWLLDDLRRAGHEAIPDRSEGKRNDVTDPIALEDLLVRTQPDAIAHLAAVSFGPDAKDDPGKALAVNVGGTINLLEATQRTPSVLAVLISGSSDVYGAPRPADLPLREEAPLRASEPYGLTKSAQEAVARVTAGRLGLPLVVTRSFNHTGPKQRPRFALPALASRVLAMKRGETDTVRVGNLDVRRDFSDVRDVARAYRLALEAAAAGRLGPATVLNVCSGQSRTIRSIVEELCELAGVPIRLEVDPALVRAVDPPEIRGDPSRITNVLGWRPEIPFDVTLRDLVASIDPSAAIPKVAAAPPGPTSTTS